MTLAAGEIFYIFKNFSLSKCKLITPTLIAANDCRYVSQFKVWVVSHIILVSKPPCNTHYWLYSHIFIVSPLLSWKAKCYSHWTTDIQTLWILHIRCKPPNNFNLSIFSKWEKNLILIPMLFQKQTANTSPILHSSYLPFVCWFQAFNYPRHNFYLMCVNGWKPRRVAVMICFSRSIYSHSDHSDSI